MRWILLGLDGASKAPNKLDQHVTVRLGVGQGRKCSESGSASGVCHGNVPSRVLTTHGGHQ